MPALKLRPKDPAKYDALSKGELKDALVRKDSSELNEKFMTIQSEQRMLRMGSAAAAALLTGILYEAKPDLENLMGTPASIDHLLALGGAIGAYSSDDDDVANACEGISMTGMVPLLRNLGRSIGGLIP